MASLLSPLVPDGFVTDAGGYRWLVVSVLHSVVSPLRGFVLVHSVPRASHCDLRLIINLELSIVENFCGLRLP